MLKIQKPVGMQALRLRMSGLCSVIGRAAGIKQTQLVVCGLPRSGTSLLYNMLSASLEKFTFEPFEKYFIHRIHKLGNIATKAPMDVMHLDHIDNLNVNKKDLVILIVVRDIRDVITSVHPIYNNEYFIGYDHSWWPQDKELKQWKYDAPGVLEIHQAIARAVKRNDCMVVRYEDLVSNPNAEQARIKKEFGLQFEANFDEYHVSPEKHAYRYEGKYKPAEDALVRESSEVTRSRVARWSKDKTAVNRVINQFTECEGLHDILTLYGYESDRNWFYNLESGNSFRQGDVKR